MAIDLFSIGRFTVHGYGLMIGLGFMAAVLIGGWLAKRRGLSDSHFTNIAIFVLIIGFAGGKLLHVIVEFKAFLADPLSVLGSEGFAVYGGIITGIATIFVYCRIKKLSFLEYIDLFGVVVPLNQALGRVGCLLAGCCYGKRTESAFSLVFPEGCSAPPHVKLIPTQPIMAVGNFIFFIIIAAVYLSSCPKKDTGEEPKHKYIPGMAFSLYLILYSVGRFLIEFLRDDERGWVGALSTSQFIAIFTLAFGIILMYVLKRIPEKNYTQESEI
ncbi:MAG: prolipoprotein diacylglyceryl transferase [Lachnospiraceae bacterium]|nr:prolipoprotein diacylglyceryl transferase [Lachnospiraceae bacterium]